MATVMMQNHLLKRDESIYIHHRNIQKVVIRVFTGKKIICVLKW